MRPGFISPGLFAQMAATFDQISHGRLDINVVPGGIQGEFERLGEQSDHAHRYARAEELPSALGFASRQADAYLAWIQPLEELAGRLERVRAAYAMCRRVAASVIPLMRQAVGR